MYSSLAVMAGAVLSLHDSESRVTAGKRGLQGKCNQENKVDARNEFRNEITSSMLK